MESLPDNLDFHEACERMSPSISLDNRYNEPWRAYHNRLHITELQEHLFAAEQDAVIIQDGAAALAFVLWHDAIYDPMAPHGRNETLSAQLCSHEFGKIAGATSVFRAVDAIMATISHSLEGEGGNPDTPLLLDCDLAILGSDPERFAEYDAAIRTEYQHIPDETYIAKRREVLSHFLKRERLFLTDWAHSRWEERARENLRSAVG